MEDLGIRLVGPKPMSPKAKKSSTKGRQGEDLEYIPKPGEVVEGFDDIDEIDLDLFAYSCSVVLTFRRSFS